MKHYTIASIILLAAMLTCIGSAGATDWHVNAPESIQDAIDGATDGDTVIVHDGIYTEQLYITKSLDLRAADGESPEIWAPEPAMLENYDFDLFLGFTMPCLATPVIMVNGTSGDISVNIAGFVIDGSSITPEISEYGICSIFYLNADGTIEENEIKNIWGENGDEENMVFPFPVNAWKVVAYSDSSNDVTIHRNNIHNYTGVDSIGIFIVGSGAKGTVSENTITGARSPDSHEQLGIAVAVDATAMVRDNIINDFVYFDMRYYPSSIVINDASGTIEGNTIIGAGIWANEGWSTSRLRTVSIKNNFVDASELSELSEMKPCGIAVSTYAYAYADEEKPSITSTIEGNQLIGVSGNGIVIGDISEHDPLGTVTATITRNTISGWDCGIELLNSSESTIYLNDFVDNTESVSVKNSTNLWNSPGKISYLYDGGEYTNHLGNHWSNYTGSDSDGDGIGEDPYSIASDNPDNCPLVEIYENYHLSITPEELFISLAGEWAFEGSMILGNDTLPISGTRTFTPTGPISADFVVAYTMGEAETTETGSVWWDSEMKKLAIKEGDEIGYSNLTINGYESRAVLEDGIVELGISEAVVSEESLTILDDATQVMEWSAVNMNGEILVNGKLTFKPVASKTATTLTAEVIPAISMTITTTGVDFGKVGTGMTSKNQVITVVNTGAGSAKVSAMMLDDSGGFYNESLRLNSLNIGDFSGVVPADTSDFRYEYEVVTKLVVPDWAGGKYDGTVLFVAESES
jgi:parallel beta-helix repeat protein